MVTSGYLLISDYAITFSIIIPLLKPIMLFHFQ